MSRKITNKNVQVVHSCVCGATSVYPESYPIHYKDFTKAGIVRKKDAATGKPFLLQKIHEEVCNCHDDY